jgi:hypothetical protein
MAIAHRMVVAASGPAGQAASRISAARSCAGSFAGRW